LIAERTASVGASESRRDREPARRITWLAEADERALGMINLAVFERMPRLGHPPSRWGYLGNDFAQAAYRNQGIGGKLIGALLNYADDNVFQREVPSPIELSIPVYQRAGFGPADALLLRDALPAAGTDFGVLTLFPLI